MNTTIEFEMKQLKCREFILLQQMGNVINDGALRLRIITGKQWNDNNDKNSQQFKNKIKTI